MRFLSCLAFCVLACSSPTATLDVAVGPCESDAITRDPAVTSFAINAVQRGGASTTLGSGATTSGATINLGDQSSSLVASIQVTGSDGNGDAVVFGATPVAELGLLDGDIPIFIQRKGTLACMPGQTADARAFPLLMTTPRGVYITGGTASPPTINAYDLLYLNAINGQYDTPATRSAAIVELSTTDSDGDDAVVVLIGDTLSVIGLATDSPAVFTYALPTGHSFAELAGGATVMADDGTAYIVGMTKTDSPSGAVLSIGPTYDPDNSSMMTTATGVTFTTGALRQGAAATWITGCGLLVYGGSATATGVQLASTTCASPGPYPSDATSGLAAVAFQSSATLVLIAGDLQPRTIDLTCSGTNCTPQPWGKPLPFVLSSPSLFAIGSARFALVGDDSSGKTHFFVLDSMSSTEIPFNNARHNARAVQTELGEIIVVGGGSAVPESFWP